MWFLEIVSMLLATQPSVKFIMDGCQHVYHWLSTMFKELSWDIVNSGWFPILEHSDYSLYLYQKCWKVILICRFPHTECTWIHIALVIIQVKTILHPFTLDFFFFCETVTAFAQNAVVFLFCMVFHVLKCHPGYIAGVVFFNICASFFNPYWYHFLHFPSDLFHCSVVCSTFLCILLLFKLCWVSHMSTILFVTYGLDLQWYILRISGSFY